jgi:hypothetical protein
MAEKLLLEDILMPTFLKNKVWLRMQVEQEIEIHLKEYGHHTVAMARRL